jgi:predicted transcriptional regulator
MLHIACNKVRIDESEAEVDVGEVVNEDEVESRC